jgi:pterin-4a-carbinolamine dehydratase
MSSLILENLLKQQSKINFDFSKSFKSNQNNTIDADIFDLPLSPKESVSWVEKHHDNKVYFERTYNFSSNDHIIYFFKEVLNLPQKEQSDVEIFLKSNHVRVFIGSLQSFELSHQEIKLSKLIDEIYDDIFYISKG